MLVYFAQAKADVALLAIIAGKTLSSNRIGPSDPAESIGFTASQQIIAGDSVPDCSLLPLSTSLDDSVLAPDIADYEYIPARSLSGWESYIMLV